MLSLTSYFLLAGSFSSFNWMLNMSHWEMPSDRGEPPPLSWCLPPHQPLVASTTGQDWLMYVRWLCYQVMYVSDAKSRNSKSAILSPLTMALSLAEPKVVGHCHVTVLGSQPRRVVLLRILHYSSTCSSMSCNLLQCSRSCPLCLGCPCLVLAILDEWRHIFMPLCHMRIFCSNYTEKCCCHAGDLFRALANLGIHGFTISLMLQPTCL